MNKNSFSMLPIWQILNQSLIFILKIFPLSLSIYLSLSFDCYGKIDFDYSCYAHLIEQESEEATVRKKTVEDSDSDVSVYSDMDGEKIT